MAVNHQGYVYNGVGERHPCADLPGLTAYQVQPTKHEHHSTYLHAGCAKKGWPHDHSVEDAYEVPPFTWTPSNEEKDIFTMTEYSAVYGEKGEALLVLNEDKQTTLAKFDTYADAALAAKALNELKGY